jgi:hypothetical protein
MRKAFEDGKNEPGAADFHYGECEMRRHDLTGTTKGERRLLWGYWLLSGYGLRASRAFHLAARRHVPDRAVPDGLRPAHPRPRARDHRHLPPQQDQPQHQHPRPRPARQVVEARDLGARAEKATRIVVNSVVFRSSGQNLTTVGTYIEMTSRLLEPTLLALGVLAIRGRIKR